MWKCERNTSKKLKIISKTLPTILSKKLNTDDKDHFFAVTEAGDHQKIKEGPLELYKASKVVEDNDLLLQSRTDPHWQILSKIIQKIIEHILSKIIQKNYKLIFIFPKVQQSKSNYFFFDVQCIP